MSNLHHNLTPELFVAELRSHIGVRYRHQGRTPTKDGGLDCGGLIIVSATALGMAKGSEKLTSYGRHPVTDFFNKHVNKYADEVPYNRLQRLRPQVQLGDLLTFWIEKEGLVRHIGAYTGVDDQGRDTFIHAYAQGARGVIETPIDPNYWKRRISKVYRFRELKEKN